MAKPTLRAAVFATVEMNSNLSDAGLIGIVRRLGYPTQEYPDAKIVDLIREAQFANSLAVVRFKDLCPDNNVFEHFIEKKGHVKFGLISDTHFGSKHHRAEEFEKSMDRMLNEGVTHFFGGGDLLEGSDVYPGQYPDLLDPTEDGQIAIALKSLPMLPKGGDYNWISGNHDLIWLKRASGTDPLITMDNSRKDFNYLGKLSAYVYLAPNVSMQLVHPNGSGGEAGAKRFIDNLPFDRRPDIIAFAHWHTAAHQLYKGVFAERMAGFQGPNNLSIRLGWENVVGAKIIEFDLTKDGSMDTTSYVMKPISFPEVGLGKVKRIKL